MLSFHALIFNIPLALTMIINYRNRNSSDFTSFPALLSLDNNLIDRVREPSWISCQVLSSPHPTPLSPSLAMLISLLALCLSSSKCCSSLLNHFPCRCWFQLPDINPQLKFPTLRMITFPPSALTYISLLALSMLYLNCSLPWWSLASSWRAERML